jgi:hypothetical protein
MSIFDLRQSVIDEYSKYVQSFLSIADERVRAFVEESLLKNHALWPDALLQLNPSYKMASTIQDLVDEGKLHLPCAPKFSVGMVGNQCDYTGINKRQLKRL